MSADAALRARLELSLHLHNLTQAEKTLLARDLLQFATPEEALRVAHEQLVRLSVNHGPHPRATLPGIVDQLVKEAASATALAVQYLDESKAREAGGS